MNDNCVHELKTAFDLRRKGDFGHVMTAVRDDLALAATVINSINGNYRLYKGALDILADPRNAPAFEVGPSAVKILMDWTTIQPPESMMYVGQYLAAQTGPMTEARRLIDDVVARTQV